MVAYLFYMEMAVVRTHFGVLILDCSLIGKASRWYREESRIVTDQSNNISTCGRVDVGTGLQTQERGFKSLQVLKIAS